LKIVEMRPEFIEKEASSISSRRNIIVRSVKKPHF